MVTGLSGSGKTAALKALEDLGFFCIDNLPCELLPKLVQLSVFSRDMVNKVAIGMDTREISFLENYREAFDDVAALGIDTEVLFLEADDDVLLKRFSETRRRHPLAHNSSVYEGICEERRLFEEIKERANLTIDTSNLNVHELKKKLWDEFKKESEGNTLEVSLMSFGFKYGAPREADIMLDVRFLPNPYFITELKHKRGTDEMVSDFVFSTDEAVEAHEKFLELIDYLLPLYEAEGKAYLTVAIGCTGGKHRSVAMVESLSEKLSTSQRSLRVVHRDIER